MRVTYNDIAGIRSEVNKLLRNIDDPVKSRSFELADEILEASKKLAGLRTPAPEWVGALVHAKNSLEKRDPGSTAISHIDRILDAYHGGTIRESDLV